MQLPNSYKEYLKWTLASGYNLESINQYVEDKCVRYEVIDDWIFRNWTWMVKDVGLEIRMPLYDRISISVRDKHLFSFHVDQNINDVVKRYINLYEKIRSSVVDVK